VCVCVCIYIYIVSLKHIINVFRIRCIFCHISEQHRPDLYWHDPATRVISTDLTQILINKDCIYLIWPYHIFPEIQACFAKTPIQDEWTIVPSGQVWNHPTIKIENPNAILIIILKLLTVHNEIQKIAKIRWITGMTAYKRKQTCARYVRYGCFSMVYICVVKSIANILPRIQ